MKLDICQQLKDGVVEVARSKNWNIKMGLINFDGVINFNGYIHNPVYVILMNGSIQKFESYQVTVCKDGLTTDHSRELHPGVFTVVGVGFKAA
jgi:hypothetical protein